MSDRGDYFESFGEQAPESNKPAKKKRAAPDKELTKEEQSALDERYGVNLIVRVKPATRTAIDKASKELGIQKGNLADFLLRTGLQMVAQGKASLPVNDGGKNKLSLPPVPDDYR